METKVVWQEGLAFEAQLDGHTFYIDAAPESGGKNKGPKPKGLTLVSLAGCTGMDVISILKKMKVAVDYFEVKTDAVVSNEHPQKFESILVQFIFKGDDLPVDKIQKAVSLSEEKYCGVSATLKPTVLIDSQIIINGQAID